VNFISLSINENINPLKKIDRGINKEKNPGKNYPYFDSLALLIIHVF
jgi:hypothetical protein